MSQWGFLHLGPCMSAQSHATSMFSEQQLLGVSTQPSPIEQPLSPPFSEGESTQSNGRKTKHISRSCILCRGMRQKCDDDRPCKRCQSRNEEVSARKLAKRTTH